MSAKSVFQRMHNRLFARLGEQAVLRGSVPCPANIEYGVTVNYELGDDKFVQSEVAAVVDVANIQAQYNPVVGDAFSLLADDGVTVAKRYAIDAIGADNGYMVRCILRDA